jgi:hypothetical protein
VRHRHTTCARQQLAQLVLDIESKEGALLHVATHMIERNLTEVRSILIELGDFKAHMTAMGTRNWIPHPRSGDVHDLWRFQGLGYREYMYRINIQHEPGAL